MTIRPIVISMALAALLAACDRAPEADSSAGQAAPQTGASSGGTTRTTPADITPPASQADKQEGRNPVQGQIDPKQGEQRQDFQQPGDDKGPQPKSGG
jgi:hypothetical protein